MVKNPSANARDHKRLQVLFLGWEDPLEKGMVTPIFLPRESHGQRSLAGYGPWGHKESDKTEMT